MCWEHEKKFDRAINAYIQSGDITNALRCCRIAELPDTVPATSAHVVVSVLLLTLLPQTVELLEQHGGAVDSAAAVQEALWAARHLKNSDRKRMMEILLRFLPNEEERLAFLRKEKCTVEYADVRLP